MWRQNLTNPLTVAQNPGKGRTRPEFQPSRPAKRPEMPLYSCLDRHPTHKTECEPLSLPPVVLPSETAIHGAPTPLCDGSVRLRPDQISESHTHVRNPPRRPMPNPRHHADRGAHHRAPMPHHGDNPGSAGPPPHRGPVRCVPRRARSQPNGTTRCPTAAKRLDSPDAQPIAFHLGAAQHRVSIQIASQICRCTSP